MYKARCSINLTESASIHPLIGAIPGHLVEDGSTTCMVCEFLVGEVMYQLESNTVKVC